MPFEAAGVLGVGVVAPSVRAGVLVVPDGERGDLGLQVVAGGEVAAAQQPAGQRPEPLLDHVQPGRVLGRGTSLGQHLAAKVDLTDIAHMEQLETRSDPARDPRGRVLATAYLALISAGAEPRIPPDTAWHPVQDLPPTAFDHGSIARSGRERLRAKLSYTNIGFALAPQTFTIAQLRDIYAASVGHAISATNLQRILTRRGVIEATPGAARPAPAGGRPATLHRFATRTLVVTNPFAAFRPPSL